MRALPTLLSLLVLLGCNACGRDPVADNHGYGWGWDLEGSTGTRVRVLDWPPGESPARLLSVVESQYLSVATCMGIPTVPRGPLVILAVVFPIVPPTCANGCSAMTFLNTGTIVTASLASPLRHELVHYLLKQSGFPDNHNATHDSPLFAACS